jgi:Tfp pilus assembly protein PilV
MEVLIGIAIFAIGMLALASMQGALTRTTAEAKVRTEAVNIAEETIEVQRGFFWLETTAGTFAYADIINGTQSVTRNNVSYTVTQDVTDHYYDLATDSFTTTAPTGITISNYKTVAVTVAWADDRNFVVNEGNERTATSLGGGEIQVTGSISHVSIAATGKVMDEAERALSAPPVNYNPGLRPEIISLALGDNKFKESLLPEPDVIRQDELVETRFDVITYSQTNAGAIFLRREEFITVACECTLQAPPGDAESSGIRPVIWDCDEYVRGQFVNKPYGVSNNNQQSQFCNECCRDHHDGGYSAEDHADTAVNKVAPFKSSDEYHSSGTFSGDHKHWSRASTGALVEASSVNAVYVEACRLVRQDGFFRVAQDFRQEDLNVFPIDYLDDSTEIGVYSSYATGAASAYAQASYPDYEANPPCIGGPYPCVADAPMQSAYSSPIATDANGLPTQMPSWTTLPLGADLTQQLRSRGLYIDYLSYDLREVLANCIAGTNDADDAVCASGDVKLDKTGSVNPLELIPFFDVQMTLLNRWNESPINVPVNATNQALADHNAHSRGVISKSVDGEISTVTAKGHRGNLGFTDTQAIDDGYDSFLSNTDMMVWTGGGAADPGTDRRVSGYITESIAGLTSSAIEVEGQNGVLCDRTPAGFTCRIPASVSNGRVKIYGYGQEVDDRWACMSPGQLVMNSEAITM